MMVDIVGLQNHPGEFLQQIIFFVGGAVRAKYSDRLPAVLVAGFLEALADQLKRFFPRGGNQLPSPSESAAA